MSIFASLMPFSIFRLSNPARITKSPFSQNFDRKIIKYFKNANRYGYVFFAKVPQCSQLSRSIKSNKINKFIMKKKITIENRNIDFFKTDLTKNQQKDRRHHEKNRFLNYKFCIITFWKILGPYDHFWVTYAKVLEKKKFAHFPKISIKNSLIIQECGQIRICVFLQKFRNVIW